MNFTSKWTVYLFTSPRGSRGARAFPINFFDGQPLVHSQSSTGVSCFAAKGSAEELPEANRNPPNKSAPSVKRNQRPLVYYIHYYNNLGGAVRTSMGNGAEAFACAVSPRMANKSHKVEVQTERTQLAISVKGVAENNESFS